MGDFMQNPLPCRLHAMAPALLVLVLASCGPGKGQFAPVCPVPGLVKPLTELSRYRGTSTDIRELVVRARVVDITGNCEPGDNANSVVTTAQIVVDVARGPAMQGDSIALPVFVAVTDAGAIYDKTLFWLPVQFPPNVDTARATGKDVRMEIPVTPQKTAAAYGIVAGFQLTPEEIDRWRRDNPRR
jgi:hypothetical protein